MDQPGDRPGIVSRVSPAIATLMRPGPLALGPLASAEDKPVRGSVDVLKIADDELDEARRPRESSDGPQ